MSGQPTLRAVERWADEVEVVGERIGRHFARSEPRRRAVGYIRELLSDAERKNGWQLAEHLGEATPDGVQHLLARADWDADAVRDDLTRYVHEHLGDPAGVLIVDETGFLKKGTKSCGGHGVRARRQVPPLPGGERAALPVGGAVEPAAVRRAGSLYGGADRGPVPGGRVAAGERRGREQGAAGVRLGGRGIRAGGQAGVAETAPRG